MLQNHQILAAVTPETGCEPLPVRRNRKSREKSVWLSEDAEGPPGCFLEPVNTARACRSIVKSASRRGNHPSRGCRRVERYFAISAPLSPHQAVVFHGLRLPVIENALLGFETASTPIERHLFRSAARDRNPPHFAAPRPV